MGDLAFYGAMIMLYHTYKFMSGYLYFSNNLRDIEDHI